MGKASQDFADVHLDIRRTADRLVDLYHETIVAHSTTHGVQAARTNGLSAVGNIMNSTSHGQGAL
jgi:hypothetical protein